MVTTMIAAFTGILLAVLLQPGSSSRVDALSSSGELRVVQTVDSFLDLIRHISTQERGNNKCIVSNKICSCHLNTNVCV